LFELVLPGLGASRTFPVDLPSGRLPFATCGRPNANERDAVAPLPLARAEKKCWFCDTFRVVEAAAGRPLAEKLSRVGVTGSLPVEKCAFWNCA
jgi:hypothetical protein